MTSQSSSLSSWVTATVMAVVTLLVSSSLWLLSSSSLYYYYSNGSNSDRTITTHEQEDLWEISSSSRCIVHKEEEEAFQKPPRLLATSVAAKTTNEHEPIPEIKNHRRRRRRRTVKGGVVQFPSHGNSLQQQQQQPRRKPYDVSVRAVQGGRLTMEDEYVVAAGGRFAAVFDGHGGSGVSHYLKKQLYTYVMEHLYVKHWEESDNVDFDNDEYDDDEYDDNYDDDDDDEYDTDNDALPSVSKTEEKEDQQQPQQPPQEEDGVLRRSTNQHHHHQPQLPSLSSHVSALRAAFEQIEAEVIRNDTWEFQGSTAVVVMVYENSCNNGNHGNHNNNNGGGGGGGNDADHTNDDRSNDHDHDGGGVRHRTLLSANVGDSRAVLSRNGRAVELTHDHKPNDEKEKSRIMALGEAIVWDQESKVHRVRNLSLARAIGDRFAKPVVSPEVDIQHFPVVEDEDEFVVLASDGLWDVMSSQDAVDLVHAYMRREKVVVRKNKSKISNLTTDEDSENYRLVLRRNMAKYLAHEAIRKGSQDNVSVVLVWL